MPNKLIYNDRDKTIDLLIDCLKSNKYISAVRVGGTDYDLLPYGEKMISFFETNSGYYDLDKSPEHLVRYKETTLSSIQNATMLVVGNIKFLTAFEKQDFSDTYFRYLVENCNCSLNRYCTFESFHRFGEWFSCLDGKKVLLIIPFKESIQQQYAKKELLFDFPFPELDLKILPSPMTISEVGNYPHRNILETSEELAKEIDKIDFDIALLGCGAYTSPLVQHLQSKNKSHIVLGGMLQMYFGVYGGRYDTPFFHQWINESWIRPLAEDKPWNIEVKYVSDGIGAYI